MGQLFGLVLTDQQLTLALALADHGRDDGTGIFPSVATIAWKVGKSERQVQRLIRQLEGLGLLVAVETSSRYRPTTYEMRIGAVSRRPIDQTRHLDVTPDDAEGRHPDVTPGRQTRHLNVTPDPATGPPRAEGWPRVAVHGATKLASDPNEPGRGDTQVSFQGRHPDVTRTVKEPSVNSKEAHVPKEAWPAATLLRATQVVFIHWRDRCRKSSTRVTLTEQRTKAIHGRLLRDGLTVDELKVAIDGAAAAIEAGELQYEHRATELYSIVVDAEHVQAWTAYLGSGDYDYLADVFDREDQLREARRP